MMVEKKKQSAQLHGIKCETSKALKKNKQIKKKVTLNTNVIDLNGSIIIAKLTPL